MNYPGICQVATTDIVLLDSYKTLKEAADLITAKKIRSVVVYDEESDAYGILGVGDVIRFTMEKVPMESRIRELSARPLTTIPCSCTVLEASMIFGPKQSILGVMTEKGELHGVVTYSDVLRVASGMGEEAFAVPVNTLLTKSRAAVAETGTPLSHMLPAIDDSESDCLIVTDKQIPVGIITKRDIVRMLAEGTDLRQEAGALMTSPLVTVDGELSINASLEFMDKHKLKRLIVTGEKGRLAGVVTQPDLVAAVYSHLTQKSFLSLDKVNQLLEEQVKIKTYELRTLNEQLEKRVEEEIAKRRKQERLNIQQSRLAAMGEMLQQIAHHWRQPLNVLALRIQDLPDAFDEGEVNREYLVEMRKKSMEAILSMSSTIDAFRNFFRESRQKEWFPLLNMVADAFFLMGEGFKEENIAALVQVEGGSLLSPEELDPSTLADYRIEGYPNEFKHALFNLLNNGKEAILRRRAKEGWTAGTIRLRIVREEQFVRLELEDNGEGIFPEAQEHLFDPYFSTKKDPTATGVSLYMTRTILEKYMGGSIGAENGEEGARFTIRLPLKA